MSPDEVFLRDLLHALRAVKLEAIVVGTVAASIQGAPILTKDIDLLVRDTTKNREKLRRLCKHFRVGAPQPIAELTTAVRIIGLPISVDIIFDELPSGLSFHAVRSRSDRLRLGDTEAVVAALEDVIASKEAAGRPKDLAQLPILRDALRVKKALAREKP